ncbi:MAG: metallophosphoesterase family protein [Solirubrobacteraceae bacterium]|nr:metallophosphoesterase family protein [Solirubrobacteraceae bacterium]
MATSLLISDLHLGGRLKTDVLRAPKPREVLKERLAEVDRVILLGDVMEFRHSPQRDALRQGLPILSDLATALRPGTEIVIVPGNHDWALIEGWNARRAALEEGPPPMGLDEVITAVQASEAAAAIETAMKRPIEFRYPGLWVEDGIYATHGHYLDVHALLPTVERLGAGALQRLSGEMVPLAAKPADYERVLAPWYAFIGASVERLSANASTRRATSSARAYERLRSRSPRAKAFGIGLRAGVAALNATGIGPLSAELSGQAMIASAMHAIDEVDARLNIGADHLIFGHCHRPGPLDSDDIDAWLTRVGTRLWNTGNWVYEPRFQTPTKVDSAYWPGTGVVVTGGGTPPSSERILSEMSSTVLVEDHGDLTAPVRLDPPEDDDSERDDAGPEGVLA